MIVYQVYNKVTESFYIGKTTKSLAHRKRQHCVDARLKRNASFFHKALRKYPQDAFEWKEIALVGSKEELNDEELYQIARLKNKGARLYNLTNGGDGGGPGGKRHQTYGIKLSHETRQKISNRLKTYFKTHPNPMLGIPSPMTGVRHTKEARIKISKAMKGVERPDMLGSKNKSARAIYCPTTDEYFEYATLAAKKYNIDLSSLVKCCKGKNKTAKGLEFRYAK